MKRPRAEAATSATEQQAAIEQAAELIRCADILVLACGAGMGVDSGLGTFRGVAAKPIHPALGAMGVKYEHMCSRCMLESRPRLYWAAWAEKHAGFTSSKPHAGYRMIQNWAREHTTKSVFAFTSNIDGHCREVFGEEHVMECHGSLEHLQSITQLRQSRSRHQRGPPPRMTWEVDKTQLASCSFPEWDLTAGDNVQFVPGGTPSMFLCPRVLLRQRVARWQGGGGWSHRY